jgi:hypothetical protein
MTRCAVHAQGHPVPEKPGWENVTISRVRMIERRRIEYPSVVTPVSQKG